MTAATQGTDPATTTWLDAWTRQEGAERATRAFVAAFGREPDGVWSAPGRVNLIGEHTDYNGGLCLPTALPHRTYVAFARRDDDAVRLASAQRPGDLWTASLGEIGPGTVDGWGAYPAGVAWALADRDGDGDRDRTRDGTPSGFDAAVDSCVPFGAGLSSSAALECAVAVALDDAWGLGLAADRRPELTRACMRAENEVVGAPTGGLDQSASLLCTPGHALLLDFAPDTPDDAFARPRTFEPEALGLTLLVIDTRAEHSLADGQYAERRRTCEDAARRLGVRTLREITPEGLDDALEALADVARRRVRHVVTEVARVEEFVAAADLAGSDQARTSDERATVGARLGALMAASHASLRDDYEVSCAELDTAVEAATAAGAVGARMTGGGFGGSAIALVPRGTEQAVADAVAQAFVDRGHGAPAFLLAPPSGPADRDV
ncbi:galactokinase [Luteimicrobium subarcticum]|uniref:Galactokinase n=1 Tax=Luteimicrobium subarcticum TaxID=620910 RepID=A0A2M8WV10_9MICO|nr:galactokinase [Luteimicrobium subarcticum]PJI94771.1 galactokinase [Luteimicrobium subarcticum]